jgi:thiol-disulfide isomerase/thioredoxin
MKTLHIKNDELKNENIEKLIEEINMGKDTFVLIYMNGCGPCEATKPEWSKLVSLENYKDNSDILVVDIDKDVLENIDDEIKNKLNEVLNTDNIRGFPTIRYIKKGKEEEYENSSIEDKSRNIDSFSEWIESKTVKKGGKRSRKNIRSRKNKKTKKHTRKRKGGKWSNKYKRSINCKKPKGFSQKQYCKYGRNKK